MNPSNLIFPSNFKGDDKVHKRDRAPPVILSLKEKKVYIVPVR